MGTGIPLQQLKWKFQNWLKIQRISRNNFGAKVNNFTKLFHVTCREAGMKLWVQILVARTRKILEGKKTSKIRHDFGQLQNLIANIFGMENAIDKL